jgi:putative oligomerization/nucleic acid binding protein
VYRNKSLSEKAAMNRQLSPRGQQMVDELAQRYGVGSGAVTAMLHSLIAGGGTMAQFDHPEFGGMGQWTRGGMTMVGDMFDHALKAKVDGLCSELSGLLASEPSLARPPSKQQQSQSQGGRGSTFGNVSLFVSEAAGLSGAWWPAELGTPASTGSQNDLRYAYFPAARRLAVDVTGRVTVYDTLDHRIGGVSQQQSGDASFTFVSQHGLVRLADLPVVSTTGRAAAASPASASVGSAAGPIFEAGRPPPTTEPAPSPAQPVPPDDIFAKIERLAELRAKGILSEEEFAAKKAELLSRL